MLLSVECSNFYSSTDAGSTVNACFLTVELLIVLTGGRLKDGAILERYTGPHKSRCITE